MTAFPALDHVALTVPDLDAQGDRLISAVGTVAQLRSELFDRLDDTLVSLLHEDATR